MGKFIVAVCLLTCSIHARAEQKVGNNLYVGPAGLYAYGATGQPFYFSFDSSNNLTFANQVVDATHPIYEEILTYYCNNYSRTLASYYRFTFTLRNIAGRTSPFYQECKKKIEASVAAAPNAYSKDWYQSEIDKNWKKGKDKEIAEAAEVSKAVVPGERSMVESGTRVPPPAQAPAGETKAHNEDRKVAPPAGPVVPTEVAPTKQEAKTDGDGHGNGRGLDLRPENFSIYNPTKPELALFCTDPYQAICKNAQHIQVKPNDNNSQKRQDLFNRILKKAGLTADSLRDFNNPYRLNNWRVFLIALREDTKVEEANFMKRAEESKKLIPQIYSGDPGQPWVQAKIAAVTFRSLADDLIAGTSADLDTYLAHCGSDGLSLGAFIKRDGRSFVCPGNFTELSNPGDQEYTVLHESSHQTDGEVNGNGYLAFEDCLRRNNLTDPKVVGNIAERTADLQTAEAFALKNKNETPEVTFDNLTRLLGNYCQGAGLGLPAAIPISPVQKKAMAARREALHVHPDHDFQFDNIFARQPLLQQKICNRKYDPKRPFCGRCGQNC